MGFFEPNVRYSLSDGKRKMTFQPTASAVSRITRMEDLDLNNKRVLIRADLNVPLQQDQITSDARLRATLPTLKLALEKNARIVLISHLGRPAEGQYEQTLSLKPVAVQLAHLLNYPVRFESNWLQGLQVNPKEIVLCENVRFNMGEQANDEALAKQMAALCDVFIMDAFATAHRAQASTVGVAQFAPCVAAGLLLEAEMHSLSKVLESPTRPLVAIVGGAKVSTKLVLLESLLKKIDTLIVGGGIANTFLAAKGITIGGSLYEDSFIPIVKKWLYLIKTMEKPANILIPRDAVVAKEISDKTEARIVDFLGNNLANNIQITEKILDVGPRTIKHYNEILKNAGTILWNGPIGVFEYDLFEQGTKALAEAIAASKAFSIAGGGETLAAIEKYHVTEKISYISTGGAAFLEYLEGKHLPAIAILEERALHNIA